MQTQLTWSALKALDVHHGPTFSNATCTAFALKAGQSRHAAPDVSAGWGGGGGRAGGLLVGSDTKPTQSPKTSKQIE